MKKITLTTIFFSVLLTLTAFAQNNYVNPTADCIKNLDYRYETASADKVDEIKTPSANAEENSTVEYKKNYIKTKECGASYCNSFGRDFSYEWIAGVAIGSFNNTSSGAAYTHFTSEPINLKAGSEVKVSLTPGFASSTYDEYWKIWIDYNKDGDFNDDNELVFDAGALNNITINGTINILSTASGTTRMRVSMKYNGAQTADEAIQYGEVEDYTVEFGNATPDTEAPSVPSGLSSSGITNSRTIITWNASSDNVGVTAYDVFKNGSFLKSVTGTNYCATELSADMTYNFSVKAKDEAGNISAASKDLSVTTKKTTRAEVNNLTLTIKFDSYPEETSWKLQNSAGSTVASSESYANEADGSTIKVSINDLANDCYDFSFLDSNGDGICCAYGNGSYTLENQNGLTLATGGEFKSFDITNFCLHSATRSEYEKAYGLATMDVYPNPASDFINIQILNGQEVEKVNIYNLFGALVKTVEMNSSAQEINISELPLGLYIVSVENGDEPIVNRFFKQ